MFKTKESIVCKSNDFFHVNQKPEKRISE